MQVGWGDSWATSAWVAGSWVGAVPVPPVPPVPPTHYYNAGLTITKKKPKRDEKALHLAMIKRSDEDFLQLVQTIMPFIQEV